MLRHRVYHRMMSQNASFSIKWHTDPSTRRSSIAAFNAFLSSSRLALTQLHSPADIHVFIGNEAADADSIVSSITYAFIRAQERLKTLHVPVLPISRDELMLRCDVVALFQVLDINTDALVFVDEFPWDTKATVKITLMDHNVLSNKKISSVDEIQVVEILDHHYDMGQHLDAEKREIAFFDGHALVASTCTLVAEKLQEIVSHCDAHKILSTMLLGVIALDSINFDPSAKKVTQRDVKAAQQLEQTSFATKDDLFKWLQAEKFNPARWEAFTLQNCLEVDYKEFIFTKKVGISVVLVDLESFVLKSKDAALLCKELAAYCKQNDVAFLVTMFMSMTPDGQCHRQLLFFQEDGDNVERCVAFLKKEGSLLLEFLELPATHQNEHMAAFNQLNTGASRKQVAPLIQRALVTLS